MAGARPRPLVLVRLDSYVTLGEARFGMGRAGYGVPCAFWWAGLGVLLCIFDSGSLGYVLHSAQRRVPVLLFRFFLLICRLEFVWDW